ncbi:putative transcriptional regulator [Nostoc sp. NIES-4103]|nr:putative transcriptional regulator [Nostoc sp. NIES-4103]
MTTDSPFSNRSSWQHHKELSAGMAQHTNESTGAMDMMKRDRFELLSAYLDGEVTAAESRQVEEWLANDAAVQCLYGRLLKLRQGLKTLPVPAAEQPSEVAEQVLARLRRRSRLVWVFGGAAIAACVVGTLSGLLPGGESKLQLAQKPISKTAQTTTTPVAPVSPLMVALNNPVIEIPKAAVVSPQKPVPLEKPRSKVVEPDIN